MSFALCQAPPMALSTTVRAGDAGGAQPLKVTRNPHEDQADEHGLVLAAQAGDPDAMRELYRRYASTVHRYAILPLVRERAQAEDLLADTFVRAMENLDKFRWQGRGVLPWLIRIAKNLTLDHLRKSGRITGWPEGLEPALGNDSYDSELATSHREVTTVLRERIEACLADVNPRYRTVLRLRLVEGAAREAAARELDVSLGTLDVLLFRACRAFRRVYIDRYGEAPRIEFGV